MNNSLKGREEFFLNNFTYGWLYTFMHGHFESSFIINVLNDSLEYPRN